MIENKRSSVHKRSQAVASGEKGEKSPSTKRPKRHSRAKGHSSEAQSRQEECSGRLVGASLCVVLRALMACKKSLSSASIGVHLRFNNSVLLGALCGRKQFFRGRYVKNASPAGKKRQQLRAKTALPNRGGERQTRHQRVTNASPTCHQGHLSPERTQGNGEPQGRKARKGRKHERIGNLFFALFESVSCSISS